MEKNSSNKNNTPLLIVIVILVFIVGFLAGQLLNKENILKENTKTEEKVESKKENSKQNEDEDVEDQEETEDEELSENEQEKESEEPVSKEERYCVICDSEGGLCCGTGPAPSIFKIETDQKTITSDEAELSNNGNKYKVKFSRNNNTEKVIVNGKTIYENDYIAVDSIGVLDNGMIVIKYNDYADQFSKDDRIYYSSNLSRVGTYQWVTSNSILDREFTYVKDQACEGETTRIYKIYKVTITSSSKMTEKLEKEKRTEDGCAGLT